jgi:uncharacterized protein YukE
MPTVHMEVEQVKAVLDLMTKDEKEIRDIIQKLTGAVGGIHTSDWEGKSEEEFNDEYLKLDGQLKYRLDALYTLAERIRQEIAEWEAMAAKLA